MLCWKSSAVRERFIIQRPTLLLRSKKYQYVLLFYLSRIIFCLYTQLGQTDYFVFLFLQVPTNLYIAEKAESGGEDEEGERSEVALDLVFVVDCTGSMGGVIRTVQDNIRNIVQKIILSEKVHLRSHSSVFLFHSCFA